MSADAFASRHDFSGATLYWWSSKLGRASRASSKKKSGVRVARVVRTSTGASKSSPGVVIEVRGLRVLVPPGVDGRTLANLISVLEGGAR